MRFVLHPGAARDAGATRVILGSSLFTGDRIDVVTAQAFATALGDDALRKRGEWMTHPENLGVYVRLLRGATAPIDAYRWIAANAAESTRLGTWELEERGPDAVRLTYVPRPEADSPQDDEMLCRAREGELVALPRRHAQQVELEARHARLRCRPR